MPSPTLFTEISKDYNIRWNFPSCIGSIDASTSESIVLQAVVDANLKFVNVDVRACGKQSDGGVFRNSALYQSLEARSLQVPEDTVLPHSEITLPHTFVGDEAYRTAKLLNVTVQKNIRQK